MEVARAEYKQHEKTRRREDGSCSCKQKKAITHRSKVGAADDIYCVDLTWEQMILWDVVDIMAFAICLDSSERQLFHLLVARSFCTALLRGCTAFLSL